MMLLVLTSAGSAYGRDSGNWATCDDQAPPVAAQTPAATDDEQVATEQALVELQGARRLIVAQRDEIGALKEQVAALTAALAAWKEADAARANANKADDEIKASFQRSLEAATARIDKLERENARLRKQRWFFGLGGLILGAGAASQAGN